MKKNNSPKMYRTLLLFSGSFLPLVSLAQEEAAKPTTSYFSNALFNTLLSIIVILGIMAVALASALKNIINSDMYVEKLKKAKDEKNNNTPKITAMVILFSMISLLAFSQEKVAAAKAANDRIGGLDQFTFYGMLVAIALELIAIGAMFSIFKSILGANETAAKSAAEVKPKTKTIFDKINDTVEIGQEETIMLDHDYDGIKELDNNLPPWWKYGFYLTILIAVVYLVNYHITRTSPLQKDEYTNSVKKAEAEIAEYMKNSANNVDESTVKMITEASALSAGKDAFIATCAACHGRGGEGGVGPNLTDEYWIHGGSVKDIFKTIKYGWPDKGMKSWKDDFSPIQIAQITSYIRTLKGTNPPNPKEKQGELYTEQEMPADSSAVKSDTTKVIASELSK
ncbi:MAG: c-type cytochrome [Bacteroidia bacterium]|nr:c-type cytochrome [Bacteroidia bacterium]